MKEAKCSIIPAELGLFLRNQILNENDTSLKFILYREARGSLLFASRVSRPDIEYAVNYASQFLHYFCKQHWGCVKKILCYLKRTIDYGIVFENSRSIVSSTGYIDAYQAACFDTQISRNGFVIIFNGTAISWSSNRQSIVSLSTAESEQYAALCHGSKEVVWLRRF